MATASIDITKPSHVNLSVLDFNGEEISVLIDKEYSVPENVEVTFDGGFLKKGVYYYLLKIGDQVQTGQLIKH